VKDIWVQAGGYVGKPTDGEILTMAQPLDGMTQDSPASKTQPPQPSEWTRSLQERFGQSRPRFHLALRHIRGHHKRRLPSHDGERMFWAVAWKTRSRLDLNIAFVGAAKPNTFGGGAYARGIKPEMYAGFESPIPANKHEEA
jgi:hypothetical protein